MRYMLVISYDGAKFHGFQRQNDKRNVQSEMERVLSNYFKEEIFIKGAGRTDSGVHAKYQVIHFDTFSKKRLNNSIINKELNDIRVKKIKKVTNDFHSRYSVKNKIYLYKIDLSNKLDSNYYLNCPYKLNIKKMKEASRLFLGKHDFRNFVSGIRDNYNTTIYSIKFYKINKVLYIRFKGIGFYRYMIRNLVGALLQIGKGKISNDVIINMLDNPNIEKRLPTVKANGLYLIKINY